MDEIAQYYHQHPYYQTPPPPVPPPPPGTTLHAPPQPAVVVQSLPIPQYHHPHQPPTPAYVPPLPVYPQHSHDDVRTLFIAGLPEDVKPREIYNLFREFAGYESSHLRSQTSSNSQPFAFAVFADQQSALIAMYELNGMVFDFEKDSKLYIELAKSNSRSKRLRPDDGKPVSEKRIKGSAAISRDSGSAGFGSIHMPGMGNSAYNTIGYPSTQSQGKFDGRLGNHAASKTAADPCPTLFVANLGQSCKEQELIQVFSRCRGFLKLKMQSTYGAPVAFVDFQDTASSTEALSNLQGTILYSSTGEGMRLEYAKARMGLRSKKSR
ncbi:U2 small nuclear ribonucleoprotein B'' isoform X1 [Capsicum annuum]|uniref:U2 small nuclear ribonucleoprotein B'' isoform X1 n=1 Tax=Capsicum annuum TaxID=4072 RepID=UPI001FB18C8B|nr:U2 small nuclear ribonucleoprotein B'' isoform X1 [Capsicum annuum]